VSTRFSNRIAATGTNMTTAMGTYHPYGTSATPMVMPLSLVTVTAAGVAVQDMTPLYTEDGAIIPATAPGSWGQLRKAGRP
jgi:hypothetical protein